MKEARKLDVLLQSASGLKKVSTSKAYAVAWIDPSVRVPSPAERNHGASPVWNTTMSVSLDERALGQGMSLTIELIGQGLVKTKRIGFVTVDISDIVLEGSKGASVHGQFHAYPVDHQTSLLFLFFLLCCRLHIFLEETTVVPVKWKDENSSLILSFSKCKPFWKKVCRSFDWKYSFSPVDESGELLSRSLFLSPMLQIANCSEEGISFLWLKVHLFFLWTKVEYVFLTSFTNYKSSSKQLSCSVNVSRVSFYQPISLHHGHWPDVLFFGGRWQGAQEGNKELSTSSFTCTSRPPSLRQTDLHLVNLLWRHSNIRGPTSARKNHHHHQKNNKAIQTVRRQNILWIRSIMDQKSGCTGRDRSRSSLRAHATEICDRNM